MSQDIFTNPINPNVTSGPQLATYLNGFRDAVLSGFSGASRPSELMSAGYWIDTSQAASPNFIWKYMMYTGLVDVEIFKVNISTGKLQLSGTSGSYDISQISEDAVGPVLRFSKSRTSDNGQTDSGDSLGELGFYTKDNTGVEYLSARIKAVAANTTTSSQQGAYLVFEEINTGTGNFTEKMRLRDGKLGIGATVPTHGVHVKNQVGSKLEDETDTSTGPVKVFKKKRVSGNGQVLSGDILGKTTYESVDEAGADILSCFDVEVTATQNHSTTAQGTKASFKVKKTGETSATEMLSIGDTVSLPQGASSKNLTIGTSSTSSENLRIRRSGAGVSQIALGNDSTAEGTKSTTLGELGFKAESFTFAGRPVTGNAGRIIYVSDKKQIQIDDGTLWKTIAGGGGGSALVLNEGANPPLADIDAAYNRVRLYVAGDTQKMVVPIKVPSSFAGGTQIKAVVEVHSPDTTGTLLLRSTSTLIRKGVDAITSTTNQRTSTNTSLTQSGSLANVPQVVTLDLSDATGQINGVAVSANDLILVEIYRGTDTATSDLKLIVDSTELVIE